MRIPSIRGTALIVLWLIVPGASSFADGTEAGAAGQESPPAGQFSPTDLPKTLPGYTLKELDKKKPAVIKVGNHIIQVGLPVFVYIPTELQSRREAVKELHELYNSVVNLAGQSSATPTDYQAILVKLDQALTELESTAPAQIPAAQQGAGAGANAPGGS